MIKIKKILEKKIYIKFSHGLFITILISALVTCLSLYISCDLDTFKLFMDSGNVFVAFIYNYIPVFLLFNMLYFISNNFIFTNGFLIIFFILISIINRAKLFYRGAYLYITDIFLMDELISIIQNREFKYVLFLFFLIILLALIVLILTKSIKTTKIDIRKRAILSTVLIVIFFGILLNKNIYNNQNNGFLYNFFYRSNTNGLETVGNINIEINKENIEKYENIDSINKENLPVIIMIQSEAFVELGMNDKINFESYEDPYKNYKEILENSYHGEMIVKNFGGGTSDTEFDVLTGMSSIFMPFVSYANLAITKETDSIASMLKKIGYYTVAIHPGERDFYEREKTFDFFGFDKFVSVESFDETDKKGGFITEEQTFNKIINDYQKFKNENNKTPYFSFNITIQNHFPFFNKYDAQQNFDTEVDFNEEEINNLSNYFVGVKDIDIELKKITEFFEKEQRPVIIVYWGDHLPSMSPNTFLELLKPESEEDILGNQMYQYTVPYFIWENSKSKESFSVVAKLNDKDMDIPVSDFYLPSILFDVLEFEGLSYYIDFNMDMIKNYPIILEEYYYDIRKSNFIYNGEIEKINKYLRLMEIRLFD